MSLFKKSSAKTLVAIGALALAFPAQAAVLITGNTTVNTTLDQGPDGSFGIGFSDAELTNPFDEILEFTTTVGGTISILANTTATFVGGPNDTDFSSVTFLGPLPGAGSINVPATFFSTDLNEFRQLSNTSITAGTYRLRLRGTPGTQNGAFGGSVAFVAGAVPEPATWLMMLLGFGAIGYSMRGKKKSGPRVQFA
jgi:PEP-CTERM motif